MGFRPILALMSGKSDQALAHYGVDHPLTSTPELRDVLLRKMLSAGGRDPEGFVFTSEGAGAGPMYRRPLMQRVSDRLDHALELIRKAQREAKEQADIAKLKSLRDFVKTMKSRPRSEFIVADPGRSPAILAHEVGHAVTPGFWSRLVAGGSRHFSGEPTVSLAASLLGGAGGLLGSPAMAGTGVGLGALQALGRLGEEARANYQGRKLLADVGYEPTPEERKAVRRAFTSYIPGAVAHMGLPLAAAGMGALFRKRAGLLKQAKVDTELLEHQKRVIERMRKAKGLVVAHGLGTGKTLTSIGVADQEGGVTKALVPASLVPNYLKELRKHTRDQDLIGLLKTSATKDKPHKTPPWKALTIPSGLLAGTAIGALIARKKNPFKHLNLKENLLFGGLTGGSLGLAAGGTLGSYLQERIPKQNA